MRPPRQDNREGGRKRGSSHRQHRTSLGGGGQTADLSVEPARGDPHCHLAREVAAEAERRPVSGNSGESRCHRCGGPVGGRRRNGYCSDKCRMRDRRARRYNHINELLSTIEAAVAALRRELEGDHEPA